jgi:tetratricopeptide (TPR) repeat protein
LASYYVVRGHLFEARQCCEELLQIARGLNDPMPLMGPHFALGITLEIMGELGTAHSHFEQAASLHNLEQHVAYRAFYSLDPGIYAYCDLGRTLTLLGYPDQGRCRVEDAMALARRTGDPLSIAHTFHVGVYPYVFLRDFQKAHDLAAAGVAYCDEHGIALYRVWLVATLGFTRVQLGDREGITLLGEGIAGLRAGRAEFGFSLYLGTLAEGLFQVGRLEEARAVLAEAFEFVRNRGDRYYEAELYRLQGEMLLAGHAGSQEEALTCFREARAAARRQGARLFDLAAVICLSRLLHNQGRTAEGRQVLTETYGGFTEGFDTAILREAKALLEELS